MDDAKKPEGRVAPSEVQRIVNLSSKVSSFPDMTGKFKKPEGEMNLRPIQSEILYRTYVSQGLLALVGVGEGKTLSSFLLPHVLKATVSGDRKITRLNSSHTRPSRMPSSA